MIEIIQMLEENYPDLLKATYIINGNISYLDINIHCT